MKIAAEAGLAGPIAGGLLIGATTSTLMLFTGRITGISGLVEDAIIVRDTHAESKLWTWFYTAGLMFSGACISVIDPSLFGAADSMALAPAALLASGFLTGFGTRMGCGCTSGHGIGGLPRLSPRSLAAVLTFMLTGSISSSISRSPSFSSIFYVPRSVPYVSDSMLRHLFPSIATFAAIRGLSYLKYGSSTNLLPKATSISDILVSFSSAAVFGLGLGIGGMLQKAKVLGFLDFAGVNGWDYSLMGVMGGGVMLNLLTFYLMRSVNLRAILNGKDLRAMLKYGLDPANMKIDFSLIMGAGLFGVGWGVSGFCPGPALVSLAGGISETSLYVPAMLIGMYVQDAFSKSSNVAATSAKRI